MVSAEVLGDVSSDSSGANQAQLDPFQDPFQQRFAGWWLNQPIWVKWEIFPK